MGRGSKKGGRGTGRRSKPAGAEGARAALITALFVAAAAFVAIAAIVVHSAGVQPSVARTPEARPLVQAPAGEAEKSPLQAPAENAPPLPELPEPQRPPDAAAPEEAVPPEQPPARTPPPARNEAARTPAPPAQVLPAQTVPAAAPQQAPPARTKAPVGSAPAVRSGKAAGRPERVPKPAPGSKGRVVIVIDDAGNNLRELKPFLAFPGPLTIAVLPGLPHSAEAARLVRASGKELFLHQPMEPLGGQNPGPGAIRVGMSEAQIRAILERNVAELGPIAGMNNHEGSKATADSATMETVLRFCRERGIMFLDSRTTAQTASPAVAARLGMRIRERDVFVDNIQERAAMIRYLQDGLQKAEKKGSAVMIGHAWSSELASTLQELYPELVEQGFSLSTISRIMMGKYDDEGLGD